MRCKYCGKGLFNPCERASAANGCPNASADVIYKDRPRLYGMPVVVDSTMPDDEFELRGATVVRGRVVSK